MQAVSAQCLREAGVRDTFCEYWIFMDNCLLLPFDEQELKQRVGRQGTSLK
jgi:hypothetical protein